jgi:hypothetical protein
MYEADERVFSFTSSAPCHPAVRIASEGVVVFSQLEGLDVGVGQVGGLVDVLYCT